jgi:two-component system, NarL family, response regulator NreC
MPVSVIIADDFPAFRTGVRHWLERSGEFQVVDEAADGPECVRLVRKRQPDVVILDKHMPGLSSFQVLEEVRTASPRTRPVVLGTRAEEKCVVGALRKGAFAYVLKNSPAQVVVEAVRAASRRAYFVGPPFPKDSVENFLKQAQDDWTDPLDSLTAREKEVLYLAAKGHTSTEIAQHLHISPRTVEQHRAQLMRKLRLRNLPALIRFALQHGVISLEE